jgi:hypothetical protein
MHLFPSVILDHTHLLTILLKRAENNYQGGTPVQIEFCYLVAYSFFYKLLHHYTKQMQVST